MDAFKVINVSDINKKRSSLRHPEDMLKYLSIKSKNINFNLEPIKECFETNEVSKNYNKK